MNAKIRQYAEADISCMQHALATWIEQAGDCSYCHVGEIPHHIYDASPSALPAADRVQIWEADGEIIGFAIALLFDSTFEVYTSPSLRGTDVETAMLKAALQQNRELVKRSEHPSQAANIDVWGCDTVRARLLTEMDLGKYRVWTQINEMPLDNAIITTPPLPAGFTIRTCTTADYAQMTAVRNESFDLALHPDLYRDRVITMPSFNPAHDIIAVAPDGTFAAFTHIWLDEVNNVGIFEPVGTHSDYRRLGLARAVMQHGLQIMQENGMTTAQVTHGITNTAAYRLYQSLGFRSKHLTYGFKESSHKTP